MLQGQSVLSPTCDGWLHRHTVERLLLCVKPSHETSRSTENSTQPHDISCQSGSDCTVATKNTFCFDLKKWKMLICCSWAMQANMQQDASTVGHESKRLSSPEKRQHWSCLQTLQTNIFLSEWCLVALQILTAASQNTKSEVPFNSSLQRHKHKMSDHQTGDPCLHPVSLIPRVQHQRPSNCNRPDW